MFQLARWRRTVQKILSNNFAFFQVNNYSLASLIRDVACMSGEPSESQNQCWTMQWAERVDIKNSVVWPPRTIVLAQKWSQAISEPLNFRIFWRSSSTCSILTHTLRTRPLKVWSTNLWKRNNFFEWKLFAEWKWLIGRKLKWWECQVFIHSVTINPCLYQPIYKSFIVYLLIQLTKVHYCCPFCAMLS